MIATVSATLPEGLGWSYEVKWDGYRALLIVDGSRARLVSRNLKDLSRDYPHIAGAASRLTSQPLIIVDRIDPTKHGELNSCTRK